MSILWTIFDIIGTLAFALSGTLVGVSRRLDFFGAYVLALCTAIGGGIMRDILVGRFPPISLQSSLYCLLTLGVTTSAYLVYRRHLVGRRSKRFLYVLTMVADTIGLGAFTVTGASVAYRAFPEYPVLTVTLALLTAVGGGIIRDVLAQRIPYVLREEVYALPTIIGGIIFYVFAYMGYAYLAAYIAFIVVVIIRMLAIFLHWSLPKLHR